jgi:hypothetical protein
MNNIGRYETFKGNIHGGIRFQVRQVFESIKVDLRTEFEHERGE